MRNENPLFSTKQQEESLVFILIKKKGTASLYLYISSVNILKMEILNEYNIMVLDNGNGGNEQQLYSLRKTGYRTVGAAGDEDVASGTGRGDETESTLASISALRVCCPVVNQYREMKRWEVQLHLWPDSAHLLFQAERRVLTQWPRVIHTHTWSTLCSLFTA